MTRRRNTLSIDELRLEEEGHAWPSRRQRLDTDFSVSTFGNVETGLVRGRSSEWSDRFNGSSSRASNESTTSSWDSPLFDEGSRGNASSWGLLPSNCGGGRRENASSWGSPPSNFGGGRRENASSWGSPPSNFGGEGRRENASSRVSPPSNCGGGRRENASSWGSLPSNCGGEGRRENASSWGSLPSNIGGEGRRENASSWGSPPSNFGGEGRRKNASSWGSPPSNFGGGRRENASSWGSQPSNFGGGRRENASSWGSQPSNFGGGRRENASSWGSPPSNFGGEGRRENASSWGSPPLNFGGEGRRENASSWGSPPSNFGGGRRENASSWGSPPSNFGGEGRRENASSWGPPPSNFGGGRRENALSWESPPLNFDGDRRENASSWGSPPSNFGGEGRRENALSWGSLPSNFGGGRRENALSWKSPPLNFDGGRRENASSWGSPPSNFGGGRREIALSWESPPLNFDGDRKENASSWSSLPLNGEGSRENVTSSSQNGSNSPNDWWTGGANGLQTAGTESFEVEEVPYSSNPKEILRKALPDAIKSITEKKYLDLTKFGLPCNYSAERIRKVLASIVIKREVALGNSRLCIVSLGAGSKAIDGKSLSEQGDRVHDCHAEVLARRGMLRFLYAQLEMIKNGCQHQSIFVKYEGSEVYTIRDGVSFHLFISKPPCGDASVFGQHEFHPNRLNRGTVRATPSNGEGAVYIPEDDKTFDHFKHGARLHKMCCSAKIARWNVIGIQGALLSLYIEPVYLSSITIGSDFNASHMRRAVYTRVSKINDLPSGYQVKDLSLYKVQQSDNRKDKAHKMSLNWCLQHPKSSSRELIECLEGTHFLSGESQLAKRDLFKCFISLWDGLASRALKREATRVIGGADVSHYPYGKVKDLAEDYQWSKWKVGEHFFLNQHYGSRWLKMPREVDQFSLMEEDRSSSELKSSFGLFRPT